MELFELLLALYVAALSRYASSRTKRYALREHLDGAVTRDDGTVDYSNTKAGAMIRTLLSIMQCKYSSEMIEVEDGVEFSVSEYRLPVSWLDLVRCRRVYFGSGGESDCEPYFEVSSVPDGDLLDPREVSSFFDDYNANQRDNPKVTLSAISDKFNDSITLSDLKAFFDRETGQLIKFNRGGTVGDEVIAILQIPSPVTDRTFVSGYQTYVRRELESWFMSLESSKPSQS